MVQRDALVPLMAILALLNVRMDMIFKEAKKEHVSSTALGLVLLQAVKQNFARLCVNLPMEPFYQLIA